jgi:predicted helicase
MTTLSLKPTHKAIRAFYAALGRFKKIGVKHEGAVSSAFEDLLEHCARQTDRTLIPKYAFKRKGSKPIVPDAAVVDSLSRVLTYGFWEAKDTDDDLEKEIASKFKAGYPRDNMLFQAPDRAILYQNGERFFEADLTDASQLVHVLDLFFNWRPPAFDVWEQAVDEFKERVPELGESLSKLIRSERETNVRYRAAFAKFMRICQASLNPNLSENAVEEMIVQHILTERIFRKVFDIGDFMQRNVIAHEIELVIDALTSRNFSRDKFSKSLEHFYIAIEQAAETISDFSEKQKFLNTVYERFFQGFGIKTADTLGIVYTPQPLVDFMVASVEYALKAQFNSSLADKNVHLLDPFTGTGNFIVNVMRRIPRSALPSKYRTELFCNEVMLLPYYVASMNIEHAFWEATGQYEAFQGVCLVDTFETAEGEQHELDMFSEENSERVERQRRAPIKVIIANPPYNAGQVNENDNNKNRKYPAIDKRVRDTYAVDSTAQLVRKLSDPYVKAIRYATDRIGDAGIVCYVNNDSFIAEKTFDGMRKHLERDFDLIYVLELGGNVRKHPELSGTTHNVFGIQVGVSINLFVRLPIEITRQRRARIFYHALPVEWRRRVKYEFLANTESIAAVEWRTLKPDKKNNWLTDKHDAEFGEFLPLGSKDAKAKGGSAGIPTVFRTYSLGVSTNRDAVVYDFDTERLSKRVAQFADDYNAELTRWQRKAKPPKERLDLTKYIDDFVNYDTIKWSRNLKRAFRQNVELEYHAGAVRESVYRPFTEMQLHFQRTFVDEVAKIGELLPNKKAESENLLLLVPSNGGRSPFWCFATNLIPNLNFVSIDSAQCFPMYTYSEDGEHRRENISRETIALFRTRYEDDRISRADVFHYVYAVLHHTEYRARYAEVLRRELPRVPLSGSVEEFRAFVKSGKKLIQLHVNYGDQKEFPLKRLENASEKLSWRVEAMKFSQNRTAIVYNAFLTLSGIPAEVFDFRLGNRSALEWVVDQYRVTRNADGGIVSDPNRADDEQYIVRLIGQVVAVSVETVKIRNSLPPLD